MQKLVSIFVNMIKKFYSVIILFFAITLAGTLTSCHRHASSNPYTHMKVKPNEQQMREDKKVLKTESACNHKDEFQQSRTVFV